MENIDWTDPKCAITEHFCVGDAIMLHSWNRLANESDGLDDDMKAKLVTLCQKMESVRDFLGCPMRVHCMFRSQDYNKLIGAPLNDPHSTGEAIDFDCGSELSIDDAHAKLEPQLETMGLRMERNTATWVHLDVRPVIHSRYFLP